ncbi:hypothetical protein L2E82_16344 [Cichorium intybus]|uniref:Uncharacterized protein n=1 Tax=Cichorium intybus TaxID=13427 RepID=A0ACB9F5V4_CICIN|nr:hypothetical protein L2E82_16344 [Cichorium intybus]
MTHPLCRCIHDQTTMMFLIFEKIGGRGLKGRERSLAKFGASKSMSNRAATRISLGKMTDALEDCLLAAAIDPNFPKVQVRAAQSDRSQEKLLCWMELSTMYSHYKDKLRLMMETSILV